MIKYPNQCFVLSKADFMCILVRRKKEKERNTKLKGHFLKQNQENWMILSKFIDAFCFRRQRGKNLQTKISNYQTSTT